MAKTVKKDLKEETKNTKKSITTKKAVTKKVTPKAAAKTTTKTPAKAKKITTKVTAEKKVTSKTAAAKKTTTVKKVTTKATAAKKTTAAKKVTTKTAAVKKAASKPVVAKKTTTVKKKAAPKIKRISSVDVIAQAMLDKKAKQVISLDLSELGTAICDHFVIANADSTTNILAIADNVEKEMYEQLKETPFRVQGKENAFWIILDYVDVVVHVFQTEYRQFYRLEELWADAKCETYTDEPKQSKK